MHADLTIAEEHELCAGFWIRRERRFVVVPCRARQPTLATLLRRIQRPGGWIHRDAIGLGVARAERRHKFVERAIVAGSAGGKPIGEGGEHAANLRKDNPVADDEILADVGEDVPRDTFEVIGCAVCRAWRRVTDTSIDVRVRCEHRSQLGRELFAADIRPHRLGRPARH